MNLARSYEKKGDSALARQTLDRLAGVDAKAAADLRAELGL